MMEIRPIRSNEDYQATLREVSAFFDAEPEPGTPEADRFETLLSLLESYEGKHFRISAPDPIEAIRFRMEQQGLSVTDMKPYIGSSNRVYEVLNGKRRLSLAMIRRLHNGLGIPADALIG
jgi:HTH-type transcriptional regulator / antitoxin HigA